MLERLCGRALLRRVLVAGNDHHNPEIFRSLRLGYICDDPSSRLSRSIVLIALKVSMRKLLSISSGTFIAFADSIFRNVAELKKLARRGGILWIRWDGLR